MMSAWLDWSGMKAKISKCVSLGLHASSGKKIDRCLSLHGQQIPYAPHGVKFLGLAIDVPPNKSKSRAELMSKFEKMLAKVDVFPLTNKQKLLIFRSGVVSRLSWLLSVEEFPISWVEKSLDVLASRFLKSWSGLARSANNALLYLSTRKTFLYPPPFTRNYRFPDNLIC